MSYPKQNLKLNSHKSGDTWNGLTLTIKSDGVAMDLTGARIDMQMRKDFGETVDYVWSTEIVSPNVASTITITNATGGEFSILKRKITSSANLIFDIKITKSGGDVVTVISGTLPVEQVVTIL
jgi:hypothetical protein